MAKDPLAIGQDATIAEAAAAMVRGRVGSLLVRADRAIVGILTERDVLRAAGADGNLLSTHVVDWMTVEPTTASADQSVDEAITTMLSGGFRHLPVTEGDDVIGIVSIRSLLAAHVGGATTQLDDRDAQDSAPKASPDEVQERRTRMFEATRALRRSSEAPVEDADAWRRALGAAADTLAGVVDAHITGTEAAGGFFEELVRESDGRLSAAVGRLRREHERSTALLAGLRSSIASGEDPVALASAADEIFAQLEAHRHRGSDLLWQAYGTELGGGD